MNDSFKNITNLYRFGSKEFLIPVSITAVLIIGSALLLFVTKTWTSHEIPDSTSKSTTATAVPVPPQPSSSQTTQQNNPEAGKSATMKEELNFLGKVIALTGAVLIVALVFYIIFFTTKKLEKSTKVELAYVIFNKVPSNKMVWLIVLSILEIPMEKETLECLQMLPDWPRDNSPTQNTPPTQS